MSSAVRYNNEAGTLGASLTNSATTITFATAPDFATLTAGQTITLALDIGTTNYEIVYLTAYTANATTGTIARAQEDSTNWPAVSHASGATWACVPTVNDFSPLVPRQGGTTSTAAPLAYFNVVDYGAKGDGSTDDAAAIQSAITAAEAVKGTVEIPPVTNAYMLSTTLLCTEACKFKGGGAGSVLRALNGFSAASSAMLLCTAQTGVVTEDVTFDAGSEYVGSVSLTSGTNTFLVPTASAPVVGTYVSVVSGTSVSPSVPTNTEVTAVSAPSGGNVTVTVSNNIGGSNGTANLYFTAPLYGHMIAPGGVIVQSVTLSTGSNTLSGNFTGAATGGNAYIYVLSGTGTIASGTIVSAASGSSATLSANPLTNGTATVIVVNETSYNYVTERVHATGFCTNTGYEFVNLGAEDAQYNDCTVDASEGAGSSIPGSIWLGVPAGAVDIKGGFLGGANLFNVQQLTYQQVTTGPLIIDNPTGVNTKILNLQGCYVYDANVNSRINCIAQNGNNLCNVNAVGTWFLALNNGEMIKGNIPSGGVNLSLKGCVLLGFPSQNPQYIFNVTGGTGVLTIEGGVLNSSPTSWSLLTGGSTSITRLISLPLGAALTIPSAATQALTTPSFPATTVAQANTFALPVVAYVVNGTAAMTVAIDATTVQVVPVSAAASFVIQPGHTFTATYASGTPTWKWALA